jgi:hypothetical protein
MRYFVKFSVPPMLIGLAEGLPIPPGLMPITAAQALELQGDAARVPVLTDAGAVVLTDRLPTDADIESEADRRRRAGFVVQIRGAPVRFDADPVSLDRIAAAATLAGFALAAGVTGAHWHLDAGQTGPGFEWIAADNTRVALDAAEMFGVGRAVARWEGALVFAARALKDAPAADYTAARHWPSDTVA